MFKRLLILLSLLLPGLPVAHAQPGNALAVLVVIDDSGTLVAADQADPLKLSLFSHLKGMSRKRDYRDTRIEVISTSLGRSVWIGTPADIRGEREQDLAQKIKADPASCNDLSGAFTELDTSLRLLEQRNYQDIWILVFSSLIDTGRPCDQTTRIELPQSPPQQDIARILIGTDQVSLITFYWVHPNQKRVWLDKLKLLGKWTKEDGHAFSLYDMENTKYELPRNLEGLKR